MNSDKIIIYQILPRLLNLNTNNKPNGTYAENGCGKMADITREVLTEIKRLGVTHVWYTGLLEHATQTDYSRWGISRDNPTIVKGVAGSPYAVKDYYDIDPDLAVQPVRRMTEFRKLLNRTHQTGLKFIMDFVPNHVARQYKSDARPKGVLDLGEQDVTGCAFSAQNNFYYLPQEEFRSPVSPQSGGEEYVEYPAKATGNDAFTASPSRNDWYETVKLNYGVDYTGGGTKYFIPIPNTWEKMLQILLFWAKKGIDGFRCDMAEMVPVEFWEWAIPAVKKAFPQIIFIAEVYNPGMYYQYIHQGHFDYLYDKVGLYDTLRAVVCGRMSASAITACWQSLGDLQPHMLNFLENHDEQRLASDFYAGDGRRGLAALVVSSCMNVNPFLIYGGQELGERGMDSEGFSGCDGRTSIFDYWSVPSLHDYFFPTEERKTSEEILSLRAFYLKVLNICRREKALSKGEFFDLMYVNYDHPETFNAERQYAFLRKYNNDLLLICANFDSQPKTVEIKIPKHAFSFLEIKADDYWAVNLLTDEKQFVSLQPDGCVSLFVPFQSATILKIEVKKQKKAIDAR